MSRRLLLTCRLLVVVFTACGAPARAGELEGPRANDPRHQLLVFFAQGREPLTTLDLPITSGAGEVGTSNLYIPGDLELLRILESLEWTACRLSERHGVDGGYVVSFPCSCEKGLWWKPHAVATLEASASIDSVRYTDRDRRQEEEAFFGFGSYTPEILHAVRPAVPGPLAGAVWIRTAIDTCGTVVRATLERSDLPDAYGDAAIAAMREWRFAPANCSRAAERDMRKRQRVIAEIVVPFRFEKELAN